MRRWYRVLRFAYEPLEELAILLRWTKIELLGVAAQSYW
jgi:hypothetical protein